ncbi:hypothetical protein [Streptomyces sp. NPDC001194]
MALTTTHPSAGLGTDVVVRALPAVSVQVSDGRTTVSADGAG